MSLITYNRPLGKALRLPLRLIPKEYVTTIKSGPLRGARWIVGAGVHGYWLGTYERNLQKLFVETVGTNDVVYDVGANVGFYTLLASRLAKNVVAFEPLPRNLSYLDRHIVLNGARNVRVIEAAVSDIEGVARFSEAPHAAMGKLSKGGSLEVRTVALDALPDLPPPTVIKMDIEGGEAKALRAAQKLLTRHRPTIFLSTHGEAVERECLEFLKSLSYKVRQISRNEWLAVS